MLRSQLRAPRIPARDIAAAWLLVGLIFLGFVALTSLDAEQGPIAVPPGAAIGSPRAQYSPLSHDFAREHMLCEADLPSLGGAFSTGGIETAAKDAGEIEIETC